MFKSLCTLLVLLVAAALPLPGAEASVPPLELDTVLAAVREHNPDVAEARAAARSAEGMVLMKRAWMPPRLGLEAMGMPGTGPALNTAMAQRWTLSQELPFPGRSWAAGVVAGREAEAMAADADRMEQSALAEAQALWYALAGTLRFRAGLARVEAVAREMVRLSAGRDRFGHLDRMGQFMDSMLAMEKAAVDALIPDVEQKIRAQRRRLATLMGRSDTTDLGDPVLDLDAWLAQPLPTREAVFAAVEAAHPALRVKRARLAAAEAARGLAWSGWLPDLMVQGSLSEDALGRRESSAMLQLSLPYVWFWGQSGEVQAAAARLEAARAGLEAERLRAREQAATLLDRLVALTESLRILWTRGYPNAVKGLRQARDGFRTTVLGPAEILMAVTDYRMSEEKLAGLVAERGQALAELESLGAGVLSASKKEKKP